MSIIPSFFHRKSTKFYNGSEPMSIDIWDPFESFSFAASMPLSQYAYTASMDWKETPDHHVFITDIPGLKKDEVKIEVEEEKLLKIRGERNQEREDKGDKWHHVERSSKKFLRTVKLPKNTNADGIKATLENGVLTVTVPKEEKEKKINAPRFIEIKG